MTGFSDEAERRNPAVPILLKKIREDRLHRRQQRRQEESLTCVKLAIQELVSRGVRVTQTAISQEVQGSLDASKRYPQVREVLVPVGERNPYSRTYEGRRRLVLRG